jgi:hypothetical protein
MRYALLALCALTLSGCHDGGNSIADKPLVSGLTISQVSVYQGLEAPVMQGGAAASSSVPIIAGKAGLLRVFVKPDASWSQHIIRVHVERTQNGVALPPLDQTQAIAAESTAADLTSTINFDLPAESVSADLTFSVGLYEQSSGKQGPADGARYPASGEIPLGAIDTGTIKVLLIPIVYGADGSNRVPDTSQAVLDAYRDRMKLLYPIRDVEVSVGQPFKWPSPALADGSGWDELLNAIVYKRVDDGAAPDVYYYGLFKPTDSFPSYCDQGCVLGLSPLAADPMDDTARASIGVGYPGKDASSDETFTHEVGHAHGRQHAPCDVTDPDRNYPYADAQIGVWGYDPKAQTLLDPMGDSRDMMSYCEPSWISDYTYKALFKRIKLVNGVTPLRLEVPTRWQGLIVRPDQVKRGRTVTFQRPPIGEEKIIERVIGGQGGRRERLSARFYAFDHLPGGLLFVPEGEDLSQLRIDGKLVE